MADALEAINPTGTPLKDQAVNRMTLSPTEFWQLVLTQLQLQDPFEVTGAMDMVQQFVTLQSATELARLSENLQQVQALLLLGQEVTLENGQKGTVTGVSLSDGVRLLVHLAETTVAVPMDLVLAVQAVPERLRAWA